MTMTWYPQFVFGIGVFDACVVMLGGLVAALVILLGLDAKKLWDRVLPAVFTIVASNIAAALVLAGTRWLIG